MYIERLTGIFAASMPTGIILDVNGVGYGIELPLSTFCHLPRVGQRVSLWIFSHVREDALRLFGFSSYEDRQAFEILLSLSGVGPKVALAILSTLTVGALERAVTQNDGKILEAVPGVGPRLAERILLELRPKMMRLKAAQLLDLKDDGHRLDAAAFEGVLPDRRAEQIQTRELLFEDLSSALENLGYKDKTIQPLLAKLRKESTEKNFQDLMRVALKQLSQGLLEADGGEKKKGKQELGLDERQLF
ncbi:MAG: Holliday junction branch migration protein RuvA [Oligoflexus sp.]|jgi:Holliday junction DNA helicase RuvA